MIKVIRNTYPIYPNVAHAEAGDICRWELARGCYRLIRQSDGESLFCTPPVNKDGVKSNGQPPTLVGVIAQVKSKNYIFEVENAE